MPDNAMTIQFIVRDTDKKIAMPMTIRELLLIQMTVASATIRTMDAYTLGYFDPYPLKNIITD